MGYELYKDNVVRVGVKVLLNFISNFRDDYHYFSCLEISSEIARR